VVQLIYYKIVHSEIIETKLFIYIYIYIYIYIFCFGCVHQWSLDRVSSELSIQDKTLRLSWYTC
jgi:hypothetical protein